MKNGNPLSAIASRLRLLSAVMAGCLAACLCGTWLTAHDFWVQPSAFTPSPEAVLPVRLFVGDYFRGEPFARRASLIERFVAVGPHGEAQIVGLEGSDPAGYVRLIRSGLHALAYRSRRSFTRLGAKQFEAYLAEEGLERISRERAAEGHADRAVREAFSRCAKALVQVGEIDSTAGDRPIGLELELVADKNPYALSIGEKLPVRLLYQGKPLAGALVAAVNRNDVAGRTATRTNQDGKAVLTLDRKGLWMIRAVHMVRPDAGVEADWESLWASLTFALPE